MGKRGPQRTPTKQLAARGSWRAKEREKQEPPAVEGIPTCPGFLVGEAKREWNRRIESLQVQGILSETYRESLAIFCQAWGEFYDVCQALRGQSGVISYDEIEGEDGEIIDRLPLVTKPTAELLRIRKQAAETMLKIGPQFGWSPSTKAEVKRSSPAPVNSAEPRSAESDDQKPRRNVTADDFGIVRAS